MVTSHPLARIQAPKPSRHRWSMQAPPPATRTPPLTSQRRPQSIRHHLYPPSRSTGAHRHRTTMSTARCYRLNLPYQPSNVFHHLKQNHIPPHYLHQHVSIGRTTPPPHSISCLATHHLATSRFFAHRPQNCF